MAESKARVLGAGHIRAIALRAEDLDAPTNGFELITIGNAFHRLKRDLVVANAYSWLAPGRVLALLLSSPPWVGDESWQRTFSGLLDEWKERVGAGARIPAGWDQVRKDRPDSDVLAANGFEPARAASFSTVHEWTVEALIGFVYSTSFLPRSILGELADDFEEEMHTRLGPARQTIDFAYELARRPTTSYS